MLVKAKCTVFIVLCYIDSNSLHPFETIGGPGFTSCTYLISGLVPTCRYQTLIRAQHLNVPLQELPVGASL